MRNKIIGEMMKWSKKMRGIQAIERSVLIDSNVSRFVDGVGGLLRGTRGGDRHLLRESKGNMKGIARVDQQQMKHNFDAITKVIIKTEKERKIDEETREKKKS